MAVVFDIVLPILIVVCILAMFAFAWRAFRARSRATTRAYDVGRQADRVRSQVNLFRAAFMLVLALLLLAIMVAAPRAAELVPQLSASPVPTAAPSPPPATALPTATLAPPTAEPTATSPPPTPTSTPPPTETATPQPVTATVSSGVGVFLRAEPGVDAAELEWLLEGTVLTVLEGQQTVDDLSWQQVQTAEGVIGWVASDFIVINQ